MDDKEKEFDIETKKNEFAAVKTMKTVLIGLAMLMCVVVKYIPFLQATKAARCQGSMQANQSG